MKFVVDCMLGRLAKWLKILGFDAIFFPKAEDDRLLALAEEEGRVLLTRDTDLLKRARQERSLFVESEDWKEQVRQVIRMLDLRSCVNPFSRCLRCNVALRSLSRREARNLATPFIAERSESFALCPRCGRVFWKGSHHEGMAARISELLDSQTLSGGWGGTLGSSEDLEQENKSPGDSYKD